MSRQHFIDCMAERRKYKRGTLDYEYLTRAARTYVLLMRGVPTTEWKSYEPA